MQPSRPKVKSGETKPPWNDQDKDAKEAGSTAGDHMGAVENLMGKATALLRSLRLNRLKAARLKSMELDQRDGHSQVLGARGEATHSFRTAPEKEIDGQRSIVSLQTQGPARFISYSDEVSSGQNR